MSLFVEVNSVDKGCPVIINLDSVVEIAPLAVGGCAIFYSDSAAVGGKTAMKVTDSYELFKQFAMQTVSSEDIARRFPKAEPKDPEVVSPVVPTKVSKGKGIIDDLKIPKL